jgi:hypothetical protein
MVDKLEKQYILVNAMDLTQYSDISQSAEEPIHTPAELAKRTKLHPTTIRDLFMDEPGVIRIGHGGTRRKRQYYTLRIPDHVVKRVLGRMTVGG